MNSFEVTPKSNKSSTSTDKDPKLEILDQYLELTSKYKTTTKELLKLKRSTAFGVVDEEKIVSVRVLDSERHDIHLKMLELGGKMGKSKADVLADLLREEGNLSEYGLPEFSLLVPEDIYWGYVGVNPKTLQLESRQESLKSYQGSKEMAESRKSETQEGSWEYYPKTAIKEGYSLVVFGAEPQGMRNLPEGGFPIEPKDYSERLRRAEKIAKEMGFEVIHHSDGYIGNHGTSIYIMGVAVPNDKIEEFCSKIRERSDLRIGYEFYSPEVREKIEEDFRIMIEKDIDRIIKESRPRDMTNPVVQERIKKYFKERKSIYGEDGLYERFITDKYEDLEDKYDE